MVGRAAEAPGGVVVEGYTGGLVETNAFLVRAGERELLVDAPKGVGAWVEGLGGRPEALLLTHQHFDHVEGAAEVVERFGCRVYAWAPYSDELTLERFFAAATGVGLKVEPFAVDVVLEGAGGAGAAAALPLAGWSWGWEVLHVPGHSDDSVAFSVPEHGWLFGGDVLMAGGIGRSDFPGGDGQLLLRGIREKVLPLGDATQVFPGHGPVTTVGDERVHNPFLQH